MASEVKTPPPPHNPCEDVLSNEDLLEIVFGYIQGDARPDLGNSNKNRHHLLHLALTCKTFCESALNALWQTLPNLLPLFKILPSLALVNEHYILQGVITDEAWARINYYGKRVRGVIIGPGSDQLSRFVYQLVAARGNRFKKRSPSSPLPNLRHLMVECEASEMDYLATFFLLGSSLEKVEIRNLSGQAKDIEFCEQLLVGLYQSSTNLQVLALEGTATARVAKALSEVGHMKSLSSLSLKLSDLPLSLQLLTLLGTLPKLSSFTINSSTMDSSPSLVDPYAASNPVPFSSLRKLEVIGAPATISRMLSRTLSSGLNQIHLVNTDQDTTNEPHHWQDCFYKIAETCKSLRYMKISRWKESHLNLDVNMLRPILDIGTIEHLDLDISALTGSGVLDKIGKSCPGLKLLALPASGPGEDNPDLSWLGYMAKVCPKLKDLSICLRLELPQPGTGVTASNRSLTHLRLGNAGDWTFKLREALPMAKFLDKLFPSLTKLEAYRNARGEGPGEVEAIDEMNLLVNALKEAALSSG